MTAKFRITICRGKSNMPKKWCRERSFAAAPYLHISYPKWGFDVKNMGRGLETGLGTALGSARNGALPYPSVYAPELAGLTT